jgi:uncharacterized membrane protein HdeD (DUF308 family)
LLDSRFPDIGRHWGWLLALGALFAVLGLIGLGMVLYVTIASMLVFGALLAVAGVANLAHVFTARGWRTKTADGLIGAFYLAVAALVFLDPIAASVSLTFILAALFLVLGLLRLASAVQTYPVPGWGWSLGIGLVDLLLAVLIFAGWPATGLWVIGMFVSIDLLITGIAQIALAISLRNSDRVAA